MEYSYNPDEPEKSIEQLEYEQELRDWKREQAKDKQEEDEIRLQEWKQEATHES